MARISRTAYICFAVAVVFLVTAVAIQMFSARPPAWVFPCELGFLAVGGVYAVLSILNLKRLGSGGSRVVLATTACNIGLATAVLAVPAPWLPEAMPLAFAVLMSTILAAILSRQPSWIRTFGATAASLVGLVIVWLRIEPRDAQSLIVWGGLLAGIGMLMEVHRRVGRAEVDLRLRNLGIVTTAAGKLGMATDQNAVGRAILEAFKAGFPHLDWGGILLARSDGLVPLPVQLTPLGIDVAPAMADDGLRDSIQPGDGLAGTAFERGEILTCSSSRDFERQRSAMGSGLRSYVSDHIGTIKSAMAVPLRMSDWYITGVITLGSTVREYQWTPPDLLLARGLADQATVALERSELTDYHRRQASTDHLTGLANRREFERVLAVHKPRETFSIMVADVDNLKMVNDEFGHEAGDHVLRLVGQVMSNAFRATDTVARIGGDEFAIFLPATDRSIATDVATRLVAAMQGVASPFGAARISIGVAEGGVESPARDVWDRADAAMYSAKLAGRNQVRTASGVLGHGSQARRWGELVPAILEQRSMECVYQPIVRLADGVIVGYEALARRPGHSDEGVEELFTAALRLGLGRDLDWLCRRAALAGAHWLRDEALLFVNVGVPGLIDPLHGIDQMLLLTIWGDKRPDEIVLELSEREAVTDRDRLREVLTEYRRHGFRFALDDVGEGYSTIEVLATARPEVIKIPRTLTRGPGRTIDGNVAAISALVEFASVTGAFVIAEGVETESDVALMRELGVTHGQGFALGRPERLGAADLQGVGVPAAHGSVPAASAGNAG